MWMKPLRCIRNSTNGMRLLLLLLQRYKAGVVTDKLIEAKSGGWAVTHCYLALPWNNNNSYYYYFKNICAKVLMFAHHYSKLYYNLLNQ